MDVFVGLNLPPLIAETILAHQPTHATAAVSTSLGWVMPVDRVAMPEMTNGAMVVLAQLNGAGGEKLQENMNPMMNQPRAKDADVNGSANVNAKVEARAGGFDEYADGSVFRMKTMDAYRHQQTPIRLQDPT